MKAILGVIVFLILIHPLVKAASGSEGVGGGDLCENRIKIVRDDIKQWIQNDGAKDLALPLGVSLEQYSQNMLRQLGQAKIQCVGVGDLGFPVTVNDTAKVCRFDLKGNDSRITCDYNKFLAMSESDQYVLVHHEYAGLAKLETPDGSNSNYKISNQISEYLVNQIVKKLAVKPSAENATHDTRFMHSEWSLKISYLNASLGRFDSLQLKGAAVINGAGYCLLKIASTTIPCVYIMTDSSARTDAGERIILESYLAVIDSVKFIELLSSSAEKKFYSDRTIELIRSYLKQAPTTGIFIAYRSQANYGIYLTTKAELLDFADHPEELLEVKFAPGELKIL